MALDPAEVVETTEVVETSADPTPETVTEPVTEVENTPIEQPEGDLASVEGDTGTEEPEAATEVPVVFSPDEDLPALLEKATPILDKYELPADVTAVIDALKAKAETPALAEYADYGDAEAIKSRLERQSYLDTWREEENQGYRLNSDKLVEQLAPDQATWLRYDLNHQPSAKYPGITAFEEGIVEAVAKEGDTVQSALDKYAQFVAIVKDGIIPTSDVPEFIPREFREAYTQLPRTARDELALLDPAFEDDQKAIADKVAQLALIQNGLDSDKRERAREVQEAQQRQATFSNEVLTTQIKFYDKFRENFTQDLINTVKFSDDPKMQSLLAHQNVALLTQAFADDGAGAFARNALETAGVKFDAAKAQQLVKNIEKSAVELATAKRTVDESGNSLDPVSLNKATRTFENTGREWQAFAKTILDQLASLTATGQAEAVKAEVAKIKVPVKARPVAKGAGSPAQKKMDNPHPYGTPQYYDWWADQEMARQAQKAASYV